MSPQVTSFQWHSVSSRTRYVMASLCAVVSLWTAAFHTANGWMWLVSAAFAFGCAGVLTDQETRIDMAALTISREGHLLGHRLWRSSLPLHDFTTVEFRRMRGSSKSPNDIVYVGLQKHTGRFMSLRYFSVRRGQPSAEANAFAQTLADTVHLQLHPEKI